ncbi:hypothetical protein HJC23_007777 [Cyclotella cryptica]|uniref:Thioredoxin domain-containing protein n=1 Tax=Cyclotella cryptica TaxID=29204 RepID=A0ABD3R1X0_9STRA
MTHIMITHHHASSKTIVNRSADEKEQIPIITIPTTNANSQRGTTVTSMGKAHPARRRSLAFLVPSVVLLLQTRLPLTKGDSFEDLWNQYIQQAAPSSAPNQFESTTSRRERHLDHWDVPTAAAYLGLHPQTLEPLPLHPSPDSSSSSSAPHDEYIGHDAAILFYAQWCRNCHAVAPSWDAIATHLDAASQSSRLIMALFDCEKNTRHMELCVAAGIKAYPTMLFVGSGEFHDTDLLTRMVWGKDRSAGPFGATTLRRTVKFQGNWQYGDQLLDWVNLMRGLSSWHLMNERGPLRNFRNGLFGLLGRRGGGGRSSLSSNGQRKDGSSLPVGIPPGFQSDLRGSSGSTAASSELQKEVHDLELKLNATNKKTDLYEKAVTHSSNLLDGMLFPPNGSNTNATHPPRDVFTILTSTDGWFQNATTLPAESANDEHPSILRSCAAELSLDYCTRVTSRETNAYIDELGKIPDEDPFPTMDEIEKRLVDAVNASEPYCTIIEACILTDYESVECRPNACPFRNPAACHYVQTCFKTEIQNEYGIALGLLSKGESVSTLDWGVAKSDGGEDGGEKGIKNVGLDKTSVAGWGIPVDK